MSLEVIRSTLAWCMVINFIFLLFWTLMIRFGHDWIYRMHGKWMKITVEQFNAIHYGGMALFKMAIILFNLAPYLALRIVG